MELSTLFLEIPTLNKEFWINTVEFQTWLYLIYLEKFQL